MTLCLVFRPNFVAVKYGQNKGRYATLEDGKEPVPSLIGDELFLADLRAGYSLTGDMVVESLVLGGAVSLDYTTASIKEEGIYLAQPVNQIEVSTTSGAIMKLWIAKSTGLILHSLVIPVPGSKEVVESIYKDAIISSTFTPDDFVFHGPTDSSDLDPDRMGFATTEEPVAFLAGESIPAAEGVVTLVGDHSSATGFYAVIRNVPCVVTNLRVLAENEEYTVHRLHGDGIIPVQGMIAAVGTDIALLRVAQIDPPAKPLPLANDVARQSQVSDNVLLLGNRKSGGVGVNAVPRIRGYDFITYGR